MRGHKEDIYDLCWAPSGLKLLSGSIDNTAIIWDFNKGKLDTILTDHKGFVQVFHVYYSYLYVVIEIVYIL